MFVGDNFIMSTRVVRDAFFFVFFFSPNVSDILRREVATFYFMDSSFDKMCEM